MHRNPHTPAFEGDARPLLVGMLAVQILLGYEWFMSGLSKLLRGGFIAALKDDMTFRANSLSGWYRWMLDAIAIPNAQVIAVLVIAGQLVLGTALIGVALIWLTRWSELSDRGRTALLTVVVGAGVIAIVMNVNFHLYTGSTHPWVIAADPFAEGVDLDSLMPLTQAILAGISLRYLLAIRRRSFRARPATARAAPVSR